jgi:hypothetical protein
MLQFLIEIIIVEHIMVSKMATKYKIKRFKGNNLSLWKLKIKAILRKDNCLTTIGERPTEITEVNRKLG